MKKVILTLILITIPIRALAFTDNTSVPTANNTPIPINTSGTTQVKTGALVSNTYMQADAFYDRYNYGYYLQPRGTNRLNYIVADNTLTYGEVQGAYFRDINDGGFYLDPNGVSILNDIRPSIIYDRNNTGYYVDPNGNSRVNAVYANSVYTYGAINAPDIYLRNAGRWASQVGSISTTIYSLPINPSWQIRDVNAQYCALSENPSWTFGFYHLEAVECRTYPVGPNRWRIRALGIRIRRPNYVFCRFACINP